VVVRFAAISAPMLPAAPPRLSMTTCWLMLSASFVASTRAMKSFPPPGGYGRMKRIGRAG
jgi:hypothetical protein